MELNDALLIAGSGITVVFIGLILTSLLIYSFSIVSNLHAKLKARKAAAENLPTAQVEADEDVVAVIAAVLEIERRLLFSDRQDKLTFTGRKTVSGKLD